LGLLRWKIKSSSVPWWRCSMRFTSKTFSAFHTDFDQDAASMMRCPEPGRTGEAEGSSRSSTVWPRP
jgi:hypothetical protein